MSFLRYPKYKDTGVEWLGEVPEHWERKPLRSVFNFSTGLNITKENLQDEGVFCVNYGEIHSKYGFQLNPDIHPLRCVAAEYLRTNPDSIVANGDFVFADTSEDLEGSGNFTHIKSDKPVFAGYHTIIARPRTDICSLFLAFQLHSSVFRTQIQRQVKGIKVFTISQKILKGHECWLPPKQEQIAIAAFLDRETTKIDELVAEQRRLIELLKEKRQAVISHAVTKGLKPNAPMKPSGIEWLGDVPEHWVIPPLYARFNQVLGKMLDQGKMTGQYPTPYLRNQDVRWDYINIDDLPSMDIAPHERDRFTVRKGDLLMVEGRELGRCAVWQGDDGVIAFQKALHRLRPLDKSEHVRFFYYLMIFVNGTGTFVANQSPNEIPHLTGEELRKYRFPKPPLREQVPIAEYLDETTVKFDALIAEAQRGIELLQERRNALISAAVTGKIDVRSFAPQVSEVA